MEFRRSRDKVTTIALALGFALLASSAAAADAPTPPRLTWSPASGYIFVEGTCGEGDTILAWMSTIAPKTIREARLIMFTGKNDDAWKLKFKEAVKHFIESWAKLKGKEIIVVAGDYGRAKDVPVRVTVPNSTPFKPNSFEEAMYLQGYAGGYMDYVNQKKKPSAPPSKPRAQGYTIGYAAAQTPSGVSPRINN